MKFIRIVSIMFVISILVLSIFQPIYSLPALANGPNLISNGTFETLDGWNNSGELWSIVDEKATTTDNDGWNLQYIEDPLTVGKSYFVTFDLVVVSGDMGILCGGSTPGATYTTSGHKEETFLNVGDMNFEIYPNVEAVFSGSIDNISVVEISDETPTDTPTETQEVTPTYTATTTDTPTDTAIPTDTGIPTDTPTATLTDTPGPSPTPTSTFTATITSTPTITLTPTATEFFYVNNTFTYGDVVTTILFAALCGILILGLGTMILVSITHSGSYK